jgi:hypothetical protein
MTLSFLRDAMQSIFRSSRVCWSMVVTEHGAIISTVMALAVFATLFFLIYALHRTLAPRRHPSHKQQYAGKAANKKKKRKSHQGRGHRIGRTRTGAAATRQEGLGPLLEHEEESLEFNEDAHDRPGSNLPLQAVLPVVLEDLPVLLVPPVEEMVIVADSVDHTDLVSPGSPGIRDRTMSSSTMDSVSTSSASCEQSGGSLDRCTSSVVAEHDSTSPVAPISAAIGSQTRGRLSPRQKTQVMRKNWRRATKKVKELSRREDVRGDFLSTSATPSRWDALKPDYRGDRASRSQRSVPSGRLDYSSPRYRLAPGPNSVVPLSPTSPVGYTLGSCELGVSEWRPAVVNNACSTSSAVNVPPSPFSFSSPRLASWADNSDPEHHPLAPPDWTKRAVLTPPPGLTPQPFEMTLPAFSMDCAATIMKPPRQSFIKANPFATDDDDYDGFSAVSSSRASMEDDQIEAELQELGGRMIGSILDF